MLEAASTICPRKNLSSVVMHCLMNSLPNDDDDDDDDDDDNDDNDDDDDDRAFLHYIILWD